MKVLFISAGDYKYGAPKSMLELMIALKSLYKIEPILLTKKKSPMNEKCDELGIENYSFWYRDIMAGSAYKNPLLNLIKQCVKYALYLYGGITMHFIGRSGLNFDEIDLIHTNLNRNDIGCYISKKYHIPHIWHLREHGVEDYRVSIYKPGVYRYMNSGADYFVAISKSVKNAWVKKGLQDDKIRVIYNGLSTSGYFDKKPNNSDKIKIVMTGHIQPAKGQEQLIKALGVLDKKYLNQIQVDLWGEAYSDYKAYLLRLMKQYDLEDIVNFCGYCDNVPQKLSEYDIGIVCSKAEGFGRVTVEYMLAGLAVIASDTGANPELIQDGVNGLLYSYGNENHMASQIEKCFNNPDLIEKYGKNALETANAKYSVTQCAQNIYKLYEEILTASQTL